MGSNLTVVFYHRLLESTEYAVLINVRLEGQEMPNLNNMVHLMNCFKFMLLIVFYPFRRLS